MQKTCRHCRGTLDPFLDLGSLQLTGYLPPEEDARPSWPLVLTSCADCGLVQLQETTPPELLFTQYWYQSGINEVMRAELHHVVEDAIQTANLQAGDVVLDIGANDGTLLGYYTTDVTRIAFEPAANLMPLLRRHADLLVVDYFPSQFKEVRACREQVKIITSIAMFYAVDDLAPFLTAVQMLLHKDGVWVVQFQDLAGMLHSAAFDNICHEHLTYWSLLTFIHAIAPYGLVVTKAEKRQVNGGSYRLTVQHAGKPVLPSVDQLLQDEFGCHHWAALEHFAWRVDEVKRQIRAAIQARVDLGQIIDLYGASTKANTLLQVCGLSDKWIRQAWERSESKWGLRTAGSDIPIVSEGDGRVDPPDALLCGIWQFRDAVLQRERDYLAGGGTLLFPLPEVDVVTMRRSAHVHA